MKNKKAMIGFETVMTAECSTGWSKKIVAAILLAGLLVKVFSSFGMASFAQTSAGVGMEVDDIFADTSFANSPVLGYREYVEAFRAVYPEEEIRAGAEACVRYEQDHTLMEPAVYTDYESISGDSIYTAADSVTEFVVDVEKEGFYHMELEYYPVAGSGAEIERKILIDGELPYREMERVRFHRVWKEEAEAPEWITDSCCDSTGYVDEPLAVYLTEGEHRISLLALEEPMLLHQIVLRNEKPAQEYTQVKAFWDAVGIKAAKGEPVHIEAEHAARTSSAGLCSVQKREKAASAVNRKNGFIGGEGWKAAGQWIEWEFDVEAAGYYHISLYDCQNYVKGAGVFRKIMIDGTIPFSEMENYHFAYRKGWREDILSDDEGVPYVFYLKQGHHTIRMEAVLGDMAGVIGEVQDSIGRFGQICCQIRETDDGDARENTEPGEENFLADLREELLDVRMSLNGTIDGLCELEGRHSDGVQALLAMRKSLEDMMEDEAYCAESVMAYGTSLRACRNWADTAALQPLAVDYIDIVPADTEAVPGNSAFFTSLFTGLNH